MKKEIITTTQERRGRLTELIYCYYNRSDIDSRLEDYGFKIKNRCEAEAKLFLCLLFDKGSLAHYLLKIPSKTLLKDVCLKTLVNYLYRYTHGSIISSCPDIHLQNDEVATVEYWYNVKEEGAEE